MLSSPKVGDMVQCWYGQQSRAAMPHHGRCGTIAVVSNGRPRNHGVRFHGRSTDVVAVPAGNLRKIAAEQNCRACGMGGLIGLSHLCHGCGYFICDGCADDGGHCGDGAHEIGPRKEARRG